MESGERRAYAYSGKLTVDFLLDRVQAMSRYFENDLTQTVIFYAIWRANVQHLFDAGVDFDGAFPHLDKDRKPVTVLEVSHQTAIPYETTRRHVNRLIARKVCVRRAEGVYIPASALIEASHFSAVLENRKALEQLVQDCLTHGVISSPEKSQIA